MRMLAAICLAGLTSACADTFWPPDAPYDVPSRWRLTWLRDQALVDSVPVTLSLQRSSLGGYAGCNEYGGSLEAVADLLSVEDLYRTDMFCPGPAGTQEERYFSLLLEVRKARVRDGDLVLLDRDSAELLRFRPR